MTTDNHLSDEELRDLFINFAILISAVAATIALLCVLPFALDACANVLR